MTDPFSVLSIGSIITSHTLIFQKYRNKEIPRNPSRHLYIWFTFEIFGGSLKKIAKKIIPRVETKRNV
ncbi:hypothetical protein L2E82_52703 [Cichorium intybus]|nr:hypothetical protein L1887_35460 [Cichorium endivia]KAI3674057.1 hypothetical protein L2E82_52703 [Cichorium intybus]